MGRSHGRSSRSRRRFVVDDEAIVEHGRLCRDAHVAFRNGDARVHEADVVLVQDLALDRLAICDEVRVGRHEQVGLFPRTGELAHKDQGGGGREGAKGRT